MLCGRDPWSSPLSPAGVVDRREITRNHTTDKNEEKKDCYNLFYPKKKGGDPEAVVKAAVEIAQRHKAIQMWVAVRVDVVRQRYDIHWGLVADFRGGGCCARIRASGYGLGTVDTDEDIRIFGPAAAAIAYQSIPATSKRSCHALTHFFLLSTGSP